MKPVEMQTRPGPKGTEHPMWAPALLPALPGLARGASGPPKLCRARGTIQKEGPFDRLAKSVLVGLSNMLDSIAMKEIVGRAIQ